MNSLKVTITISDEVLDEIVDRTRMDNDHSDEIIRDEVDMLTDSQKFWDEVIPQVKNLVEYKYFKDYYDELSKVIKIPRPHNGRGRHHRKGVNK